MPGLCAMQGCGTAWVCLCLCLCCPVLFPEGVWDETTEVIRSQTATGLCDITYLCFTTRRRASSMGAWTLTRSRPAAAHEPNCRPESPQKATQRH